MAPTDLPLPAFVSPSPVRPSLPYLHPPEEGQRCCAVFARVEALTEPLQAEDSPDRERFIEEFADSVRTDMGPFAQVEVVEVTEDGKIVTSVVFPGTKPEAAEEAEKKLSQGMAGLAALSQNMFITGLGTVSVDTSSVGKTNAGSATATRLGFSAAFSNPEKLVFTPPPAVLLRHFELEGPAQAEQGGKAPDGREGHELTPGCVLIASI